MRLILILLAPFLCINLLFSGCESDTEIIHTTDTLYLQHTDTLYLSDTIELNTFIHDTATTWILLRHAETSGSGTDPALSAEGQARAQELQRILKHVPLDAAFATQYQRTRQTAQPAAADHGLSLQEYNATDYSGLAKSIEAYPGGTVLVTGHSNTVPALLNWLTKTNVYSNLPESQYDNLYLVQVSEPGRAKVIHMKYGKATP